MGSTLITMAYEVRDHIPLEQGLRQVQQEP